jgi:serine/threonine-protein kinase
MNLCSQCKTELPAEAGFCPTCGTATGAPIADATQRYTGSATPIVADPSLPPASMESAQDLADSGTIELGTIIRGRYRILDRLGSGNMGSVYRAQDLSLQEHVALKFITQECSVDESCASRLVQEVRLARQVTHPNVCRVHDIGDHNGAPFISMEYVDGEDLSSLIRRIGRVHGDKAHEIGRQLCAGLQAAHEQGVLHCDLKPANVMLDGDGDVRIADFGIAAAMGGEESEQVRGTPAYMAPELFTGAPASVATDLYSLGLVLYEVYTGEKLFEATSMTELLDQHRTVKPRLRQRVEDLDPKIEMLIGSLLDRDPSHRPSSAMAVLAQIPGGDPLAAALASGETPSPELVAEAGGASPISRQAAWIMVAVTFAGWLLMCVLGGDAKLVRRAGLQRSGQILAQNAEDLATTLFGPRSEDGASAWRFERNDGYARRLANDDTDQTHEDWTRKLEAPWPNFVDFFYRWNPRPIAARNVKGRIQWNDPPFETPGMIRLRLAPSGKLVELQAIPLEVGTFATPTSGASDAVWDKLFVAAGLDRARLQPIEGGARLIPHAPTTTTAAWTGTYPGTETRLRVEAAELNGRPVHFVLVDGSGSTRVADRYPSRRTWRYYAMILLMIVATGMAWFNVARGRSDRRGAAWIGIATVGLVVGFTMMTGDHNGRLTGFFELVNKGMGHGLLVSGQLIVFYLALEPHVRRSWPETMISWSRLLAGRFRDSLVGYHILVGVLVGVGVALFLAERYAITRLAGQPEGPPLMFSPAGLEAIVGPVSAVGSLLEIIVDQTRNAMKFLLGLIVLRLLVKNKTAAALSATALFACVSAINPGGVGGLWHVLGIVGAVITVGTFMIVLVRFGVLSVMVSLVVSAMLIDYPMSLDPDVWHSSNTLMTFVVIAVLLFHAHRCATRFSK